MTGPLWGTVLLRAAQSLGRAEDADLCPAAAAAAEAAAQGIADRGKCAEGQKTLLDGHGAGPARGALGCLSERCRPRHGGGTGVRRRPGRPRGDPRG